MSPERRTKEMLKLTVRIRGRDAHEGKPIADLLLTLYKERGLSGATVLQGVRGFGVHGVSRADVLGLSINLPLVIETVETPSKIEGILSEVKTIVGDNGLITIEDVRVP